MIEKKDLLEEMLNEEFARLAKEEENAVQKEDIGMLEEVEGDIYTGIQEKIQEMEREKQKDYLYAQLSEEDLRALELGRKIMEREAREERDGKIIRKKKRIRMFIGLAAALVMAMGVGVTSIGGPERIIQMIERLCRLILIRIIWWRKKMKKRRIKRYVTNLVLNLLGLDIKQKKWNLREWNLINLFEQLKCILNMIVI